MDTYLTLSEEQKIFADENINIVFRFLKRNHLDEGEYYDEVIFRYMRSVQIYFERSELRQYAFSTIACRNMSSAVYNYRKKLNRMKRYGVTLSLDYTIPGTD